MGDLGWIADALGSLVRPGGMDVFGPAENVWLVALGLACVGPLVALVVPRLSRAVGLALAPVALGLSFVATVHEQTMLALGLITVAITAGFVASWSTRTLRETVGPLVAGRQPQHRPGNVALSRGQARSFDYLVMR
jgi:hypothetical protein